MLVGNIVHAAALQRPDDVALVHDGLIWTFAELADRVDALAAALLTVTMPGDRVAVLSENTAEFVVAYYAVPRAGLSLVHLNYRLHPAEHARQLDHAGVGVLLGEGDLIGPVLARRPVGTVIRFGPEYEAFVAEPPPYEAATNDHVAWIIYTSGTTGEPKGVMLTDTNLTGGVVNGSLGRPVAVDEVYLFPFPMCHVSGFNILQMHLHRRPVVLLRRFDPDGLFTAVARHGVTAMSLAPTMIAMLLDHPNSGVADVSSLRSIGYGASGIAPDLVRRALDRFDCDLNQGYGMTELSGNATFLDGEAHRRGVTGEPLLLRTAGRPGPLCMIRIVDDDGAAVPVGVDGEVVVKGDQVTIGYLDAPELTEAAFIDGWFRTGDIGRFDVDGLLSIVDRKKDIIVTGGENVSSREVEDVLLDHPDVRQAAVIGIPDERWGEKVVAAVVASGAVDAETLRALVRGRLAGYKVPKEIVFLDQLPTTPSGKVQKHLLRTEIL